MSASQDNDSGRYGPAEFRAQFDVSRETLQQLERYAALLVKWQRSINLIAPSTIDEIWLRHMADSAQLITHIPGDAVRIADIGSGAGFPGLVLALCLADRPGLQVDLIESNAKKCAFLNAAIGETGAPARVVHERIENVGESLQTGYQVVVARALAPLDRLLVLSAELHREGAISLFLKGQDVDNELTEATKYWKLEAKKLPSATSPSGTVLIVKEATRV